MVDYNLRSRLDKACQDTDHDSRSKKKIKVNERVNVNGRDVVNIDSGSETDNEDRSTIKLEAETESRNVTDAWIEHPASQAETDFYNFEKDRRRNCFIEGQIWAIYDDFGLPSRYVQIDKISSSPTSVSVTFLKHTGSTQQSEEQNAMELGWCRPVCGTFAPYSKGLKVSRYAFSHIVRYQSVRIKGRRGYSIYPKKGDVWAIYKDADKICTPRMKKYQLVEILTDYRNGVKAVYLVKLDGEHRSLFQRLVRDGVEVSLNIGRNQLDRISHQVPSFRIEGQSNTLLNGCFELDPSSLPFFIDNFIDEIGPKVDNKFLYLKFLDIKSLLLKEKFKENIVWAIYDDRDGLPRSYAVIENVSGRECINWLEPCPYTEDEKRWFKAGLPIACGNFRLKKTIFTQDYSMFSHPMPHDWDHCGGQYNIYPRKGEVWGIYRDWEMMWSSDPRRTREEFKIEYDFVEILEDFDKNEGVIVLYLVKVAHFNCLFQRQRNENGVEIPFIISGNELYRFSFQIQHYKIQVKNEIQEGSVVLDPLVVFQKSGESYALLEDTRMDNEMDKKNHNKFVPGQIWAMYDDPERVPRYYAIINQAFPNELKVEVLMLVPHPVHEEEMEWVDKNLPIACGTFRVDKKTFIKEMLEFSHLASPFEEGERQKSFYKIIPQKGEVWAIYEDLEIVVRRSNSEETPRYQMVEILSCFNDVSGVNVASLIRVDGPGMVFQRHSHGGFDLVKQYSNKELFKFSHRVMASRIAGGGKDSFLSGHWKIDSAGMPS